MAIRFETFGPFIFGRSAGLVSSEELSDFSKGLDDKHEGLSKAIGVYVFSLADGNEIVPWYVGKTDKGFARRFYQHHRGKGVFLKIAEQFPEGSLNVFLIARMTSKGKFMRPKKAEVLTSKDGIRRRTKPLKSIDRLEFSLIGTCLAKNPQLINMSQRAFHEDFHVPGYMDVDEPSKDRPAKLLRRMLRVKK